MRIVAVVLISLILLTLLFMEWITWSDLLKLSIAALLGALFILALPHGM